MNELSIEYNFHHGAYVSIECGDKNQVFEVSFFDKDNNSVIYSDSIKSGQWCAPYKKEYVNWVIKIMRNGVVVLNESLSLENASVYIGIEYNSLDDVLYAIARAREFSRIHKCNIFISTKMNQRVSKIYLNEYFIEKLDYTKFDYMTSYIIEDNEIDSKLNINRTLGLENS